MKKILLLTLSSLFITLHVQASDLIVKKGELSVEKTVEKITNMIEQKDGLGVFTIIDHKKNALNISMDMHKAQVIIFGNPRMGTKIMGQDPLAALDLPLKILVYSENNTTNIVYRDPQEWRKNFKLDSCTLIDRMSGALDKITTTASKK
ncbi:MAG: Unknown protein [uncultured Sulfurovum sp.]|uniref:DUF302 domain-containing protein n=1 Tax=uncultured Sulfurovum sp. TaxID=269237 RepID=A0A6S6TQ96_9BACT|nr:MAG: Unknown protein [uncultured Sulfurovum sp.]